MAHSNLPLPTFPTNGDEAAYPTRLASFTKGLPHNSLGEVDPTAYTALLRALTTGQAAAFAAIPLGGQVKLANPQAAYAFELKRFDPLFAHLERQIRIQEPAQTQQVGDNLACSHGVGVRLAIMYQHWHDYSRAPGLCRGASGGRRTDFARASGH